MAFHLVRQRIGVGLHDPIAAPIVPRIVDSASSQPATATLDRKRTASLSTAIVAFAASCGSSHPINAMTRSIDSTARSALQPLGAGIARGASTGGADGVASGEMSVTG